MYGVPLVHVLFQFNVQHDVLDIYVSNVYLL